MAKFLGCLLLFATINPSVWADVYKWTDADGIVHYGDRPPRGAKKLNLFTYNQARANTNAAPAAPLRAANQFQTAQSPSNDDQACAQARAKLSAYENSMALVERNADGIERELTAEERGRVIDRAKQQRMTACGEYRG